MELVNMLTKSVKYHQLLDQLQTGCTDAKQEVDGSYHIRWVGIQ